MGWFITTHLVVLSGCCWRLFWKSDYQDAVPQYLECRFSWAVHEYLVLLCHLWALSSWVSQKYQWLSVGHFAISLHCRNTPQRCLLSALCSESCTKHRHLYVSECVFYNGYTSQGFSGKRLGLEISLLSPCWALMSRCQLLGRAGSDRLILVIGSLWLVPGPNFW